MRIALTCLALTVPATSALAEPRLALPIDCTPGDTCYIQNYMDRDPGPEARDYTCAGLTYDGHKGIDFGLPSITAMRAGVEVLAAATGRVKGARNGMIDKVYTPDEDERIDGRDCGNGVVIDHGDGWETQYCHMRQGSVRVSSGQEVEEGTVLGLVGLSGRTQFPHLHISVRHNGQPVDPFTPGADPGTCGPTQGPTLWSDDLSYTAGAILNAGFSVDVPDYAKVKSGEAAAQTIPANAPSIVIWGYAFGGQAGDVMQLEITGPDGPVFASQPAIDRDQALFYRAGGKRLRAPLTSGRYSGTVVMLRDGEEISRKVVEMDID